VGEGSKSHGIPQFIASSDPLNSLPAARFHLETTWVARLKITYCPEFGTGKNKRLQIGLSRICPPHHSNSKPTPSCT
jgi:hypothetical protein